MNSGLTGRLHESFKFIAAHEFFRSAGYVDYFFEIFIRWIEIDNNIVRFFRCNRSRIPWIKINAAKIYQVNKSRKVITYYIINNIAFPFFMMFPLNRKDVRIFRLMTFHIFNIKTLLVRTILLYMQRKRT